MEALTPAERRGALVVALLLALGALHDLWRASRPAPDLATDGRVEAPAWIGDTLPARAVPAGAGPLEPGEDPPRAGVLDLNRASARELEQLPGIGPVLAGRIVSHRERYGPFGSLEELLAVRGIGPRLFARLRSRLVVAAGGAAAPAASDSAAGVR